MTIRFAAVGLSHNHIYNMTKQLLLAGAELAWVYEAEPERLAAFSQQYPGAKVARSLDEILEDKTLHLVASAANPAERADLGIQVMEAGKDFLSAKPGFTTLEQLAEVRRVQGETGRFYTIYFSERLGSAATVKAGELVHGGAIGRVIQTIGFGPHKLTLPRPDWTFHRQGHGGLLNDLGGHQVDQFLYFTGSTDVTIVASQVGNFNHPQYPDMDDFADMTLRSERATGYVRVDWLTPSGLDTWGDVRLFILGTDGTIEIRKNCDLGRSSETDHLFLADQRQTQVIDCREVPLPFAAQFLNDLVNRTETAITQAHCFFVSELALMAVAQAHRIGHL
jgi:predicted dehydrogenase